MTTTLTAHRPCVLVDFIPGGLVRDLGLVIGSAVLVGAGNLVIYAIGVPYLAVAIGVGLPEALALGALPFLIGDGLKILLAVGLLPAAWRLVGGSSAGRPSAQ